MTISIVTGLPGFGKTLKLCEFGYKAMMEGKHVYANFRMKNLPYPDLYHHFNDPLEVLGKVQNALILMSEVGILLDQLKMYEIPEDVWIELRQHRKDGVNIMADAQSMSDVAYPFRKLIQFQYHIYAKYSFRLPFRRKFTFLLVRCFNPQPKGDDYGRRYWVHNPRYFDYFDTNYKLEETPSYFDIAQLEVKSPYADRIRERSFSYGRFLRE